MKRRHFLSLCAAALALPFRPPAVRAAAAAETSLARLVLSRLRPIPSYEFDVLPLMALHYQHRLQQDKIPLDPAQRTAEQKATAALHFWCVKNNAFVQSQVAQGALELSGQQQTRQRAAEELARRR